MTDGVTFKARFQDQLRRLTEQRSAIERAFRRLNPNEKQIVLIAVAILVLGLGTVLWWQMRADRSSPFATAVVKRGSVTSTIAAAGTIEPVEVVDVGAQVAGQVSAFGTDKSGKPIDYRSVVATGDVLAKIDDSLYAADLAVAKGQLERDKAGELSAQANLEETKAKLT